jgi:hypothetical protein
MSFRDDIESTIEIWKKGSITWKVISGLALLSGSIALLSIGDSIFVFRGIVTQLLDFYHQLLLPVTRFLNQFFQLNQAGIDAIILSIMLYSSFSKALFKAGDSWIEELIASAFTTLFFICVSLAIVIYLHWGILLLMVAIVITGNILSIRDRDEPKAERIEDLMVLEYFGLQIALAFILLAVSEGLTRPL